MFLRPGRDLLALIQPSYYNLPNPYRICRVYLSMALPLARLSNRPVEQELIAMLAQIRYKGPPGGLVMVVEAVLRDKHGD